MTWGVNLGLNNITNAVNMAKSIAKAFKSATVKQAGVVLDLIEIGASNVSFRNVYLPIENLFRPQEMKQTYTGTTGYAPRTIPLSSTLLSGKPTQDLLRQQQV